MQPSQPCPSTVFRECRLAEATAVPERPSSRGLWQFRVHACFLALFHWVAQQPKGFAPSQSFRTCAVEQGMRAQSSSSKVLGDALLPRVSSEIKPRFTLEPHRPNQARRWLSHLPGSNTIELQSSLEQRRTPGQPGNKDKLWVIISRLVPHRSRGFAKSPPGSLVASPVQMTMAGEEEGGVVPV